MCVCVCVCVKHPRTCARTRTHARARARTRGPRRRRTGCRVQLGVRHHRSCQQWSRSFDADRLSIHNHLATPIRMREAVFFVSSCKNCETNRTAFAVASERDWRVDSFQHGYVRRMLKECVAVQPCEAQYGSMGGIDAGSRGKRSCSGGQAWVWLHALSIERHSAGWQTVRLPPRPTLMSHSDESQ